MASKQTTEFLIDGKIYRMSGYEQPDYIRRIAAMLSERVAACKELAGWKRLPVDERWVMVAMNLGDEFLQARSLLEQREEEITGLESALYETRAALARLQARPEPEEETAASAAMSALETDELTDRQMTLFDDILPDA